MSKRISLFSREGQVVLSVWLFVLLLTVTACGGGTPAATQATATFPNPPAGSAVATRLPYPAVEILPDVTSDGSAATGYPPPNPASSTMAPIQAASPAAWNNAIYMPYIGQAAPEVVAELPTAATPESPTMPPPTETATAAPGLLAGPSPTPISLVDFAAVATDLAERGEILAYNKIGFHVTFLEQNDQLDAYMERIDAEGVPFFLKSVDNAEPIYKAQELMKDSGVPHTLVYRSTLYDVPNYDLDPVAAAEAYWELEKAIWPPELDPSLVWFETMNELDKARSEWLAQFSLRTAQLALRDGYKWAAFGWAAGEPEPSDWESPAMLELLRLIAENPDQLAIALHEYSYTVDDIAHDYPYKVGRFLELFRVADEHGIPRPTVLITEWGWTYNNIPPEPLAMEDVAWAARLYGAYPEVKGAAIWNLGKLEDTLLPLNTQMSDLIDNMLALSLDSTFSAPAPPAQTPLDPGLFPPPSN